MNSMMPRLATLNSPSKLKARGSESGAEHGDLAVVDVASQLGRVLVLLVLRLEGADAHAVLLAQSSRFTRTCCITFVQSPP